MLNYFSFTPKNISCSFSTSFLAGMLCTARGGVFPLGTSFGTCFGTCFDAVFLGADGAIVFIRF